jgi:hypothetical protein
MMSGMASFVAQAQEAPAVAETEFISSSVDQADTPETEQTEIIDKTESTPSSTEGADQEKSAADSETQASQPASEDFGPVERIAAENEPEASSFTETESILSPVEETDEPITPPVAPKIEAQETLIEDISGEPAIEAEPVGIDTVSLENPQGNWLFKRIWWERAEERYEKIRIMVDAIWESRNTFFKERNQLDRTVLDPFYMAIGIDRGELQTILTEINDFLEKQREQQGDLTEQERVLYETYATEEETLKQLKLDVDMITNLDHAIDDALGTFMNQINRVRNYESEAWKNFKEIAHILNDTKARELYYMVEGAARNIKTISTYLEQEFFTHFNKLVEEAKMRVARVQSQMDALKEKGVSFQKQAEQLEQQNVKEEEEQEEEEVKPKPKLGWFDWMVSGASDVFNYIWSIIRMPYDMIFGK